MPNDDRKRVFLVDDHPVVREGLAQLINLEKDLVVCGEADGAADALKTIHELSPDVAVVDMSLQGMSGLQLVKELTSRHKGLPILVLSMHDERVYAERALSAGAKGYIMKQEATKNVVSAIRRVMAGQIYLSDELSTLLGNKAKGKEAIPEGSSLKSLSDRELEVLLLIGQGYKPHEIAERLHLSVKTIETYREHIKDKLNLANGAELIRFAIETAHSKRFQ